MDLSSISSSRYAQRAFQPVFYHQPQYVPAGAGLNPAGASPIPGSNWPADNAVWVSQCQEVASLEKAHVSEIGQRMLGRMAGLWEVQSWAIRHFQVEQNSMERAALASQFMTRNAISTLMALESRLTTAGKSIDIYA
jgi:hypothetical protein